MHYSYRVEGTAEQGLLPLGVALALVEQEAALTTEDFAESIILRRLVRPQGSRKQAMWLPRMGPNRLIVVEGGQVVPAPNRDRLHWTDIYLCRGRARPVCAALHKQHVFRRATAESGAMSVTPLEHTLIGAFGGSVEVVLMQPMMAFKNAMQEGRPIPRNPVHIYRGLTVGPAPAEGAMWCVCSASAACMHMGFAHVDVGKFPTPC